MRVEVNGMGWGRIDGGDVVEKRAIDVDAMVGAVHGVEETQRTGESRIGRKRGDFEKV